MSIDHPKCRKDRRLEAVPGDAGKHVSSCSLYARRGRLTSRTEDEIGQGNVNVFVITGETGMRNIFNPSWVMLSLAIMKGDLCKTHRKLIFDSDVASSATNDTAFGG
jgi:hypothetical protein